MNSPLWQIVGALGVAGFAVAIALSVIARKLFVSGRPREEDLGARIISAVGGGRNAREADAELARRRSNR
jgi:hypothetical protein